MGGRGAGRGSGLPLGTGPGRWPERGRGARLVQAQEATALVPHAAKGLRGVPLLTPAQSRRPTLRELVRLGLAAFRPGWPRGWAGESSGGSWQAGLWERLAVPSEFPPPPLPRLRASVGMGAVCRELCGAIATGCTNPSHVLSFSRRRLPHRDPPPRPVYNGFSGCRAC